jgi:hypothetical protein
MSNQAQVLKIQAADRTKTFHSRVEAKRRSNEDIIQELMQHSKFGGLAQAFVMAGLRVYAESIASTERPEAQPNAVIDPALWHDIATDTFERLEMMYKQNNEVVVSSIIDLAA